MVNHISILRSISRQSNIVKSIKIYFFRFYFNLFITWHPLREYQQFTSLTGYILEPDRFRMSIYRHRGEERKVVENRLRINTPAKHEIFFPEKRFALGMKGLILLLVNFFNMVNSFIQGIKQDLKYICFKGKKFGGNLTVFVKLMKVS